MDPLSYGYNYSAPGTHTYSYNVKVELEPISNPRVIENHSPSADIENPMHNAPNSIQNVGNSIQNIPNSMINQASAVLNTQLPLNLQRADNIAPMDMNSLGMYNPGLVSDAMALVEGTLNMETEEDSKEHLKPLLAKARRKKKPRGRISNYWNKKVTDANFPFYGCTICNVSFTTLHELDQHVTIHKGRLTSYDLRLKNQRKRKLLKKQSKKVKKLSKKLKKEDDKSTVNFEIEIKPEDGYIGNEEASKYTESNSENVTINSNNEQKCEGNGNTDENVNNESKVTKESDGKGDETLKAGDLRLQKSKETIESDGKGDEILKAGDPRLQKLFKCFACHKQFALGYYLKLHVRSHTDEKPYTCAQCGQSFITASKLGRHNKRIHLAVRYQCRICFRLFSRFEYLVRHFDKKHAEQKLDGEPYDYNAILPYLKDLEDQLMQTVESKDVKEPKPETHDWAPIKQDETQDCGDIKQDATQYCGDIKQDDTLDWRQQIKQDETSQESHPLDVVLQPTIRYSFIIEEDEKVEIEIKKEKEDPDVVDMKEETFYDDDDTDAKVNFKDEGVSDEDYFPSNTWAAPPEEPPPEPPVPPKRRFKRKDFPMKCEHCEKTISNVTYMRVHLRTHTGEKPFKCYVCGRGFITSSKMHRHVLTHGDAAIQKAKLKMEGIKEDPDKPADDEETGEGKKKGKSRKKKNKGSETVKPKRRNQPRPHACNFCNKRFLHQDMLMVHQKCHEGEKLILKCNFCLEEQPDEETLKTHEATHTGPKPYLCTECNRTYTKKESMVYHRKTHFDTERKAFTCDICSKSFNEQCKLQRHIVSHRVDKFTLRYECPVCAHMFHTKYHVEMHLATHLKEGTISENNRSEILAMVLQNARKIPKPGTILGTPTPDLVPSQDERSTVCNICGEVFQHFYYLEEHLKSHASKIAVEDMNSKEEVRKHVCPVCNKGFKLPYYLKLHSFTHTKEKPYICQQCGKGFITKGKLKRHLESHTGLKKYQCHICYKFFTRPSYQRIHVRTIHGTQDYNFTLDGFGKQFDTYSENSN